MLLLLFYYRVAFNLLSVLLMVLLLFYYRVAFPLSTSTASTIKFQFSAKNRTRFLVLKQSDYGQITFFLEKACYNKIQCLLLLLLSLWSLLMLLSLLFS